MKRPTWPSAACFAAVLLVAGCGGGGKNGAEDGGEDPHPDVPADDLDARPDGADGEIDPPGDGDTADTPADVPPDVPADELSTPGAVVTDPGNPRWLMYSDGSPFFLCGPGDPEDFLYRGARSADGTRDGDQMEIIGKLRGTGANSIYMQAVRSHGGDGDATHNPFVDGDPASGFSEAILDQWETWFAAMDGDGIVIYFFFYDDSARIWDTGDEVGAEERVFVETLVDRFEHHGHLVWAVAEEYQERYSAARVSAVAAVIDEADATDHAIAVHKLDGLDFSELAGDPSVDQFAVQYNVDTASELHDGMVSAWGAAAGRYGLAMSEAAGYGNGETARRKSWAVAMGGAYVMALGWDVVSTPVEDLRDCGTLRAFMEATSFRSMAPHDELARGGALYVLAAPGESYIVYATGASEDPGIGGMAAGTYDLVWLDIPSGTRIVEAGVALAGGDETFARPAGVGDELALFVTRP